MKPPFVVSENGALDFYPTLEAMLRSLEAVDVESGEYQVYDGTGKRIVLDATAPKTMWGKLVADGEIVVRREEEGPAHIEELKRLLLGFLRSRGEGVGESISLDELLERAVGLEGE